MLDGWTDFFVAAAGASAALAGLIIVAMSVSIDMLIKFPGLTSRAATAIAMLVAVTVIALVGLMPTVDTVGLGIAGIFVAALGLVFALQSLWVLMVHSEGGRQVLSSITKGGLNVAPFVAFGIGGVMLVSGSVEGLTIMAIGAMVAVVASVVAAWVMLVEIRR